VSPDSAEGILQIISELRPVTIDRLWLRLVERVGRKTGTSCHRIVTGFGIPKTAGAIAQSW
jgi:hypothetical protein